jgi:Bacterial Ig domain/Beta-propeller repeat
MFSRIGIFLWLAAPAFAQVASKDLAAVSFSTRLGGAGVDIATAVAVDELGNVYVAGYTDSAVVQSCNVSQRRGGVDAFVAKWSGINHVLEYCSYVGGSGDDRALAIAVDTLGNAYITGSTTSTDLPTTSGAFQRHTAGAMDAFVAKLDATGLLVFSTYLGGSGPDSGHALSLDQMGNVTVVGDSQSSDFPVLNAYQTTLHGQSDVFVARLNSAGTALLYATYLGGQGDDHAIALALDDVGNAYITGNTTSADFPTANPLQGTSAGGQDGFVAKISYTGNSLVYSTYMGGSGGTVGFPETGAGIAVDDAGEAFVTGATSSSDFPTTANAFQVTPPGGEINAFVVKLNAAGNGILYGTYLGGSSVNYALGIAVDNKGTATVAGFTASPDFPTVNAMQPNQAGSYDAFVAKLNPTGTALVASTLLGGSDADDASAVAIDTMGNTYVVGQTASINFPPANPTQSIPGGSLDAFFTQFSSPVPVVDIDTPVAGSMLSGVAIVSGWAIDAMSAIGAVQVQVDGTAVGTATYGVARPDICASGSSGLGCPNIGYVYSLNTSGLSVGAHTVSVSATDRNSNSDVGSASISIIVAEIFPSVHLDFPANNVMLSGTVTVSGWAIDNTAGIGTAIGSVQIEVDGVLFGSAIYGTARTDVCTAWPGRPSCPNVGFTYQLNTTNLSPGSHSLTAVATNSDSTPRSTSSTITFQVKGPPSVSIDAPGPGTTVSGTVTIAGWAMDNTSTVGTAISKAQVFVDGALAGNATYGVSRPDVCAAWPGRPGCPNVGYTYQWNTSALAAGQHTITVSATNSDGTPDSGMAGITVTVSKLLPTVVIDSPYPAAVISGSTTISGWALDSAGGIGTAISGVQVKVDGVVVGNATYGTSRPDVCAAYPGRPGCPNVGFTYSLNTLTLTAGAHTVTVSATDSDGTPDVGSASVSITVLETPPTVYIDAPAPGAIVSGVVTVAGWAIDSTTSIGTAIGSVQIKVDGVLLGNASYGTVRSDVCGAWPGRPGCPNVGFTYALNTAGLSMGSHSVTAVATDTDGTPLSSTWTISFQVTGPPTVVIDSPRSGATVSGTVTLAGWAIESTSSTVGTAISSVQVNVDGVAVGTAAYGVSRPDVCAAYPGRSGCPNVGFTFAWNTVGLATGSHTISVSATDSGETPAVGLASITVVK